MSTAVKILIISWVVVGYFIVGGISFYLGRVTAPTAVQSGGQAAPGQQQQQLQQPQQYQPQPTEGNFPTPAQQQFQGGQQQQFGQPPR